MAITKIEFGSLADPEIINNNFEYLDEKVIETSSKIYDNNTSLESMVTSQISTLLLQVTSKIEKLYPVGAIYISTTDECPVASLFGTWEKVSKGRVLQGATDTQTAGNTVEAGLPDHKHDTLRLYNSRVQLGKDNGVSYGSIEGSTLTGFASQSNKIYGKSDTVQPPAYLVNIWRRIA